jgi:cation transport ATPase
MALEPRTVSLDEENVELIDMKRRFWVAVALSLPDQVTKGDRLRVRPGEKIPVDGIELAKVDSFESVTGKGVKGIVDKRSVALGNRALLEEAGIDPGELAARAESYRSDGQTVMFVIVDKKPAGLVGVADPIKESTPEAIRQLHEQKH